jgi:hypothetical protein
MELEIFIAKWITDLCHVCWFMLIYCKWNGKKPDMRGIHSRNMLINPVRSEKICLRQGHLLAA